jgi:hypothetical protein
VNELDRRCASSKPSLAQAGTEVFWHTRWRTKTRLKRIRQIAVLLKKFAGEHLVFGSDGAAETSRRLRATLMTESARSISPDGPDFALLPPVRVRYKL